MDKKMIQEIQTKLGRCVHHLKSKDWWKKNYSEEEYLNFWSLCGDDIYEKFHNVLHNIKSIPHCECGKKLKFNKKKKLYNRGCCRSCSVKAYQLILKEDNYEKYINQRKKGAEAYVLDKKLNPEKYKDIIPNQIGYWLKKGLTEKEAKKRVSERQAVGKLSRFQERYGEKEGLKRWVNRQIKWQTTLKSKPQEEIDRINALKANWKYSDEETIARYKYNKEVDFITESQPLGDLKCYNKRAFRGFHLDHKISKYVGFMFDIPPEVIGDISNLQMLPWKENKEKSTSCYSAINRDYYDT